MNRIIFDCDPGHDDAIALAMLKGLRDKIKTEMVIASYGNQDRDKTLNNTLNLVNVLKLDAKVYEGSSSPLVRECISAGSIHGESGLDGPSFPKHNLKSYKNGILKAIELVMENPNEITFVSVGPLTDLAICIKAEPEFVNNLKEIVIMGGSMGFGNVTRHAEFNIYSDPEAAQIVFSHANRVVQFGLDLTMQLELSQDIASRICSIDNYYIKYFKPSVDAYTKACISVSGENPHLHDPSTIAYLYDPTIFEFTRHLVHVDTKTGLSYGKTITSKERNNGNVLVARYASKDRFYSLLEKAIRNI